MSSRGKLDDGIDWAEYDMKPPARARSPWVLVGSLVTAGVLTAGLMAFRSGNQKLSQAMMRARVIAQGATVAIMLGSSGYMAMNKAVPEAGKAEQAAEN